MLRFIPLLLAVFFATILLWKIYWIDEKYSLESRLNDGIINDDQTLPPEVSNTPVQAHNLRI